MSRDLLHGMAPYDIYGTRGGIYDETPRRGSQPMRLAQPMEAPRASSSSYLQAETTYREPSTRSSGASYDYESPRERYITSRSSAYDSPRSSYGPPTSYRDPYSSRNGPPVSYRDPYSSARDAYTSSSSGRRSSHSSQRPSRLDSDLIGLDSAYSSSSRSGANSIVYGRRASALSDPFYSSPSGSSRDYESSRPSASSSSRRPSTSGYSSSRHPSSSGYPSDRSYYTSSSSSQYPYRR